VQMSNPVADKPKAPFFARRLDRTMAPAMLTLPNLLTLSRIVAVPLLVALLWWPRKWQTGPPDRWPSRSTA
jgi:phosphatidylglycerophosphate synthase